MKTIQPYYKFSHIDKSGLRFTMAFPEKGGFSTYPPISDPDQNQYIVSYHGPTKDKEPVRGFLDELEYLINKHSMENESDTPDYILADFMSRCLTAFELAVQKRDLYYEENNEQP